MPQIKNVLKNVTVVMSVVNHHLKKNQVAANCKIHLVNNLIRKRFMFFKNILKFRCCSFSSVRKGSVEKYICVFKILIYSHKISMHLHIFLWNILHDVSIFLKAFFGFYLGYF